MPTLQNEASGVDSFIVGLLSADATLKTLAGNPVRVYSELAPQAATYPLVLLSFLASVDRNTVGMEGRIFTEPVYAIVGITQSSSFGVADQIADRLDAVLVGARGTSDSGTLFISNIHREEIIRRVEVTPEGVRYNRVGGRFRAFVNAI